MSEDQGEIQQYIDNLFVKSEGHTIGSTLSEEQKLEVANEYAGTETVGKKSTQEIILESQGQTAEDVKEIEESGDKLEVRTKLSTISLWPATLRKEGKDDNFIAKLQLAALKELVRLYPREEDAVKERVTKSSSLKKYAPEFGWEEDE